MKLSFLDCSVFIYRAVGSRIIWVLCLGIFAAAFESIGIFLLFPLIEKFLFDADETSGSFGFVDKFLEFFNIPAVASVLFALMASFFLLKSLFLLFVDVYQARIKAELQREFKRDLFEYFVSMDVECFLEKDSGYFLSLMNREISRFVLAAHHLVSLAVSIVSTFVYCGMAILVSWQFGLMALSIGVIVLLVFRHVNARIKSISRSQTARVRKLSSELVQVFYSMKYIAATSQFSRFRLNVLHAINSLSAGEYRLGVANALATHIREPVAVVCIFSLLGFHSMVLDAEISALMVSVVLFYRTLTVVLKVQSKLQSFLGLQGSIEKIFQVLSDRTTNLEVDGLVAIDGNSGGEIRFEGVSFGYRSRNALIFDQLDIKISPRSTVAIVGPSGSGKSTFVDLLCLTLKPNGGHIILDGVLHDDVALKTWRSRLGYVTQNAVIFDGSISDNISMWDRSNEALSKVKAASAQVALDDFIESLPHGYDTMVGERGVRLSGGQRQRLAIARELYRAPMILILDEATSSLDSHSERAIQESIDKLRGTITVVIIAHRLSTIKNVDMIFVFDCGQIIECGTYMELRNKRGSALNKMIELQQL